MPQDRYRPQPYEQCAKVLAKMGYEEDAKQIQVAKHKKHMEFKRKELPRWPHTWDGLAKWVGYCGSWLFGKTTGFGYYPFRAAVFMLALILLGSAIFTWGYFAGGMTATQTTFLSKESNGTLPGTAQWKRAVGKDDALQLMAGDYPHFKGLFYSLDTFIPLIDLHQESYWMPNANAPVWGYVLWGYLWFHILAGWVLTTLLIAGLTGIMRNHDRG